MDVKVKECSECHFKEIHATSTTCKFIGYHTYQVTLVFLNQMGEPVPTHIISTNNQFIIIPDSFEATTTNDGMVSIDFVMIPINGFTAGDASFILQGFPKTEKECNSSFIITFPNCGVNPVPFKINEKGDGSSPILASMSVYPNPASSSVNIQYEAIPTTASIEIYDLTGRRMVSHQPKESKGVWTVDIQNMATGIYVVVLKDNDKVLQQQKLQVN
jgi:hypothetical protein